MVQIDYKNISYEEQLSLNHNNVTLIQQQSGGCLNSKPDNGINNGVLTRDKT